MEVGDLKKNLGLPNLKILKFENKHLTNYNFLDIPDRVPSFEKIHFRKTGSVIFMVLVFQNRKTMQQNFFLNVTTSKSP